MKFYETVDQISALLRQRGRVAYRALKREFSLDDEALEDLKAELIDAQRVATDEDGKVLVWTGSLESKVQSPESEKQKPAVTGQTLDARLSDPRQRPPISYTPAHLAERIRAAVVTDERKTITALFADLKGSTALIEGLDPEEARAIIDPALQLMMDAAHRYEGYVAQVLGDGIFALFGAPISHEDHPQRALSAALRMQEDMRRYSDDLRRSGKAPLQMRVGVNTGEVVLRSIRKDDLHADYVPVGHSTNLAARMEQLASPGTILVTAYTHHLTEGYFEFKPLGETQIKGVAESLPIYEVLGAGPLRTKLQVSVRRGLTRFVGRHSELEHLQQALAQGRAGRGQIVGVMGEPGLGKSRLFYEFKLLAQSGCLVLEAYSVSHGKASPYLPVIELLMTYFQIQSHDDERSRRQKVIGRVLELDHSLEDTLPYLFALLGIEEQPSPLQQMDPQIRRKRTFEAIKKIFLRESLKQPVILIFEDLHWIDTETQGFLDSLSESIASAKILLLTNYRPEYRHEWGTKTYYTQLRLAPLGKAEAEEFLTFLLGHDGSLTVLKHLILEKTEGTPFFMEEIVQDLIEQGMLVRTEVGAVRRDRPSAETLQIPTSVQAVLAARIDRLTPDEKALLQQLAVIGREFPLSLVRHVVTQPEDEVYRVLASLQHKEFLYEQPAFPEVEYIFKHALTQDVAYGSVLIERRKALHERTAQAIELLYKNNLEEHYSDLAHHYTRSGNTQKAVEYLQLAGQQAVQRSAYAEAINQLSTALELFNTLPNTSECTQQELTLHIDLCASLQATKGYAAPEVEHLYIRARELCQQVGETPQLFPVLFGLWTFYIARAEYQAARELGDQWLSLTQRQQDPTFRLGAYWTQEFTLFWLGEWEPARGYSEQARAFYDRQKHSSYLSLYGSDLGVWSLTNAALVLWGLGYPDQALQRSREALTLAQELAHPFSLGWALDAAAWLHQCCREQQVAQEQAEAAISLSLEQGFAFWLAWGTILQGWALVEQGQAEEGIACMHKGMDAFRFTGAKMAQTQFLALLAEASGKVGKAREGLIALDEALIVMDKTGERFYEAELYRLKGELLLRQAEQLGD